MTKKKTGLVPLKDILPEALAGLSPSEAAVERCRRRMAEMTVEVRQKDKCLRSVAKIKSTPTESNPKPSVDVEW